LLLGFKLARIQPMNYLERDWPHRPFEGKADYLKILTGADVRVCEDVLVPAGKQTKLLVRVGPETIPPFEILTLDKINRMNVSVRSQLAQRGFDISDYIVEALLRVVQETDIKLGGNGYLLEANGTNWSKRDMLIKANTGVFSFSHWDRRQNLIGGKTLKGIIRSNNSMIGVSGEEGIDYAFMHYPVDSEDDNDIVGIYAKIDDKKIAPREGSTPVVIQQGARNYRAEIEMDSEEVAPTDSQTLLICQTTSTIKLAPSVNAVLARKVVSGIDSVHIKHQWSGMHINSLYLYGGRTEWPIKLEILGKNAGEDQPRYTVLYFGWAA
jgi:hypothetical protein